MNSVHSIDIKSTSLNEFDTTSRIRSKIASHVVPHIRQRKGGTRAEKKQINRTENLGLCYGPGCFQHSQSTSGQARSIHRTDIESCIVKEFHRASIACNRSHIIVERGEGVISSHTKELKAARLDQG